MKTYIYLVLSLPLWISSPAAIAAPAADENRQSCEAPLNVRLSEGQTATALEVIALQSITVRYDNTYYPTKFTARKKWARFNGGVVDAQGNELSVVFDIKSVNLSHDGLKPNWSEPTDGAIYANNYDLGEYGQKIILKFQGYGYRTPFAATSRFAIFTAVVETSSGEKLRINVRVSEKNQEPNGKKPAIWKRENRATVSVAPL